MPVPTGSAMHSTKTPKPTRIQYKLFTGYTFQRDKYKYYKMNRITFKIHVFV